MFPELSCDTQPLREFQDLELANYYDGPLMTYEELAQMLGVSFKDPTNITPEERLAFARACLETAENPHVQKLERGKRIRVYASAEYAFQNLT